MNRGIQTFTTPMFLAALVFSIGCAKRADISGERPLAPNISNGGNGSTQEDPLRLCVGRMQIVEDITEPKKQTIEGIFTHNTLVSRLEGPVTYCLRLIPRESGVGFDAFIRIEYEDSRGTTVIPYRSMKEAFYADVWWSKNSPGERIVNAVFVDGQGLIELWAKGSDESQMVGDIQYYNFKPFSEVLEDAIRNARDSTSDQTVANKLGYNYFKPPTNVIGIGGYTNLQWWNIYTELLDSAEAVKLGNIKLDLWKSLESE